jgi:hypothetical protein
MRVAVVSFRDFLLQRPEIAFPSSPRILADVATDDEIAKIQHFVWAHLPHTA